MKHLEMHSAVFELNNIFHICLSALDGNAKESSGGMSFCVTLKPALSDSPSVVKNATPTRTISQEAIAKKLRDAQERREVL